MIASKKEFQIKCIDIRGVENRLIDLLTRWHLNKNNEVNFKNLLNLEV